MRTLSGVLSLFLIFGVCPLFAQEQSFQQWSVNAFDNHTGMFAVTVNDSNAVLGEACFFADKSCQWRVVIDVSCKQGTRYSILANTDKGAAPLEFVCDGPRNNGTGYAYIFNNWKVLEGLLKTANIVGFAMPMEADQFKVYRFSLIGMTASTAFMEKTFSAQVISSKKDNPVRPASTATETL